MDEKLEGFVIIRRNDLNIVERHFQMGEGDSIDFRVTVRIKDDGDPTVLDLHRASVSKVIRHLLTLLPADYGSGQFVPGPRKSTD